MGEDAFLLFQLLGLGTLLWPPLQANTLVHMLNGLQSPGPRAFNPRTFRWGPGHAGSPAPNPQGFMLLDGEDDASGRT